MESPSRPPRYSLRQTTAVANQRPSRVQRMAAAITTTPSGSVSVSRDSDAVGMGMAVGEPQDTMRGVRLSSSSTSSVTLPSTIAAAMQGLDATTVQPHRPLAVANDSAAAPASAIAAAMTSARGSVQGSGSSGIAAALADLEALLGDIAGMPGVDGRLLDTFEFSSSTSDESAGASASYTPAAQAGAAWTVDAASPTLSPSTVVEVPGLPGKPATEAPTGRSRLSSDSTSIPSTVLRAIEQYQALSAAPSSSSLPQSTAAPPSNLTAASGSGHATMLDAQYDATLSLAGSASVADVTVTTQSDAGAHAGLAATDGDTYGRGSTLDHFTWPEATSSTLSLPTTILSHLGLADRAGRQQQQPPSASAPLTSISLALAGDLLSGAAPSVLSSSSTSLPTTILSQIATTSAPSSRTLPSSGDYPVFGSMPLGQYTGLPGVVAPAPAVQAKAPETMHSASAGDQRGYDSTDQLSAITTSSTSIPTTIMSQLATHAAVVQPVTGQQHNLHAPPASAGAAEPASGLAEALSLESSLAGMHPTHLNKELTNATILPFAGTAQVCMANLLALCKSLS